MKNLRVLFVSMFFLSALFLMAQPQRQSGKNMEKFKSEKIAYISTAMSLTPEEAEVFWPIYNEATAKKEVLLTEMRDFRLGLASSEDEITEEKAKEALSFFQNHMKKMNALTIEYQNKYEKALSAKKVLLLIKAEKEFRRRMLKKLGKSKKIGQKKSPKR